MADFEIETTEGSRWVKVTLRDETIVAERGALSHYRGDVRMKGRIPGPIRMVRASLSGEEVFRPSFSGTGLVFLESSLGGFKVLDLAEGETWIVESGAYWASEERVKQTFIRNKVMVSLRTGRGLVDFQTKLVGPGKAVICAPGEVAEIVLGEDSPDGMHLACDGGQVVARTEGIQYRAKLPGWMPWSKAATGERVLRSFTGPGRLLICTTPYWRWQMAQLRAQQASQLVDDVVA